METLVVEANVGGEATNIFIITPQRNLERPIIILREISEKLNRLINS
jgi:hypothetical protein